MEAYARCVGGYDFRDIEAAVNAFLRGDVPGYNPRFAPTAPQLGTVVRRCRDNRLDSEHRSRPPALPAPDVVKDDASRERVRALMQGAIENLATSMRTEEAAGAKRKAETLARLDDRFRPDHDPIATAKRLGFQVGDPDAETGDWGERGAA